MVSRNIIQAFVGLDENGVPRHAHKRGLYTEGTGLKGNVDECNPCYSFHHISTSHRLYVFETLPAESHSQHLLRDEICSELLQVDSPSDSSANALSAMLMKIRDHLHWGRFTGTADGIKMLSLYNDCKHN